MLFCMSLVVGKHVNKKFIFYEISAHTFSHFCSYVCRVLMVHITAHQKYHRKITFIDKIMMSIFKYFFVVGKDIPYLDLTFSAIGLCGY